MKPSGIERSRTHARGGVIAALVVLSFVSSGAWLLTSLPPVPVAKALQLLTVAAWLVAVGLGAAFAGALDRRVAIAVVVLGAAVAASWAAGGWQAAAALYDLYADMPLVQWLAFPTVFTLAAALPFERQAIERGLRAVLALGAVLAVVMAYQYSTFGRIAVFGSTAYAVTALAPLIPLGVALAARARGAARVSAGAATGLIFAGLSLFSGSLMGTLAALFAAACALLVHPRVLRGGGPARVVRAVLVAGIVVGLLALMFAQVPSLGGRVVNADSLGGFDKNVVTRAYLWEGAERMTLDRPLLGFGPSGYRLAAVRYLDPEALQFGPDVVGNADPTVYSPQSPHSVLWEALTRLGTIGGAALLALLVCWALALRARLREPDDAAPLRAALAAAFVTTLFVLLVNPVLFAIGLLAPAAAGLSIASVGNGAPARPSRARIALAVAGALLAVVAVWLGIGETRLRSTAAGDSLGAIAAYEGVLDIMPGHPMATRLLLEQELAAAAGDTHVAAVHAAIDRAPGHIRAYAPNLVSFAAISLTQAERTGRSDLSWERAALTTAGDELPPIPSLAAEQLHLAIVARDAAAIRAALPEAQAWGSPYPFTSGYLDRAWQVLAELE